MFIGHLGIAFAAKRVAPQISLGALFAATMWLDLIWPFFLLVGWEQVEIVPGDTVMTPLRFVSYPLSHSLLMVLGWAVLGTILCYTISRDRIGSAVIGMVVVSHWLLDVVVHRPDLPLYPAGPEVGLGLWNFPAGAISIELLLVAVGVYLYVQTTQAMNKIGRWSLIGLLAFVGAVFAANLLGPPPPDPMAIALVGLLTWLLPLWAWWIDRNRQPRHPGAVPEPRSL
jgi:hypothetical protein